MKIGPASFPISVRSRVWRSGVLFRSSQVTYEALPISLHTPRLFYRNGYIRRYP